MRVAKDAEGKEIKVGDWVGFKSDIEQYGQVTQIAFHSYDIRLKLENENGFDGAYIGGSTITWEDSERCWLED